MSMAPCVSMVEQVKMIWFKSLFSLIKQELGLDYADTWHESIGEELSWYADTSVAFPVDIPVKEDFDKDDWSEEMLTLFDMLMGRFGLDWGERVFIYY